MLQGKVQQTEQVWFNRQNRYGSTDRTGMAQQTEQVWFNRQNRYGSTDRTGMVQQTEQGWFNRQYRYGSEKEQESSVNVILCDSSTDTAKKFS
jgi:hypothetical protein